MPISIPCPSCKVNLKAPDNLLGKTVNCPKCKTPVKLVAPSGGVKPAAPPAKTAPAKPAAPAPAPAKKPAAPPSAAVKKAAPKPAEPEVIDDLDEAAEDELDEAGHYEGDEGAELSDVAEKFLRRNVFLIKGQSGMFSMSAAYDILNPETKAKIGQAKEVLEGTLAALRFFLRRNWLASKIEIREEETNELVFIVRRPAYFWSCKLEVRDADDKLLATFVYKPMARLLGKPLEILYKGGKKFAELQFYLLKGRCDLVGEGGKELANMMTESAYTRQVKVYWAPRGGSYYVTFNQPLAKKPHEKMIFLGATLAMDLLQEDAKNAQGAGRGGISIGT